MFVYEYSYDGTKDVFAISAKMKDSLKPESVFAIQRKAVIQNPLDDLKGTIFAWLCDTWGLDRNDTFDELLDDINQCFENIIKLMIAQHPTPKPITTPSLILPRGLKGTGQ